jgi:hypothetical protein
MITFGQLGRYGRLGNQMFQVASTIGIAIANGYDYAFPRWVNHDAAERFGSTEDKNIGAWFPNWEKVKRMDVNTMADYHIPWGWHGLNHPDGWSYTGHMQSEKYFAHCAGYIRELFTFSEPRQNVNMTAVHVRCGDYGGEYHPICTREYYEQAFALVPGPYMVFSDDPDKAKEIIEGLTEGIKYHRGGTYEALFWMTCFRRHIIANSSFSWWAAWLADSDKVVAPATWFGPAAELDPTDIYCQNWTVL